jgi:hypothetical protein
MICKVIDKTVVDSNTYTDYLGINQEIKKNMFLKKEEISTTEQEQESNCFGEDPILNTLTMQVENELETEDKTRIDQK